MHAHIHTSIHTLIQFPYTMHIYNAHTNTCTKYIQPPYKNYTKYIRHKNTYIYTHIYIYMHIHTYVHTLKYTHRTNTHVQQIYMANMHTTRTHNKHSTNSQQIHTRNTHSYCIFQTYTSQNIKLLSTHNKHTE